MTAHAGHWWCLTCDDPPLGSCHRRHQVEWVDDGPVRAAVTAQRRAAHTHQFQPASVTLDPDRVHEWFEQMRKRVGN